MDEIYALCRYALCQLSCSLFNIYAARDPSIQPVHPAQSMQSSPTPLSPPLSTTSHDQMQSKVPPRCFKLHSSIDGLTVSRRIRLRDKQVFLGSRSPFSCSKDVRLTLLLDDDVD